MYLLFPFGAWLLYEVDRLIWTSQTQAVRRMHKWRRTDLYDVGVYCKIILRSRAVDATAQRVAMFREADCHHGCTATLHARADAQTKYAMASSDEELDPDNDAAQSAGTVFWEDGIHSAGNDLEQCGLCGRRRYA